MPEENYCIVELRQKIEQIKASLSDRNERQVTSTRVEPILRILGWNLEDADEVTRDFDVRSHKDKRVDIALGENLEGPDRKPHVFIEVKASKESVDNDKHISQLDTYCLTQGLDMGVLTNGTEWRFYIYENRKRVPAAEINIRQDTDDCAAEFVRTLSRRRVLGKQHLPLLNKSAFCRLTDQVWEAFLNDREDMKRLVQGRLRKKRGKLVTKKEEGWLEEWVRDKVAELHSVISGGKLKDVIPIGEPEIKPEPRGGIAPPSEITHIVAFGKQINVKNFREARIACLQELESKHPRALEYLSRGRGPVCSQDKTKFRDPRQIGSLPYWTDMHGSASDHRRKCRKALDALGLPSDSVRFFNGDDEYP